MVLATAHGVGAQVLRSHIELDGEVITIRGDIILIGDFMIPSGDLLQALDGEWEWAGPMAGDIHITDIRFATVHTSTIEMTTDML